MNTHVPEEYGGPGASYLDGCIIEEELVVGLLGHHDVAQRQRPGRRAARAWAARRRSSGATSAC